MHNPVDYEGAISRKASSDIAALLGEWRTVVSGLDWSRVDDCAWWYGERASVSQLAGAAWRMKGWAMQEYSWTRGEEASHARIDLCVELHDPELRFVAEAKQIWPWLNADEATITGAIEDAFKATERQLSGVESDGYESMQLVFVTPRLHRAKQFEASIASFLRAVQAVPFDAVAWTFPRWARPPALLSEVTGRHYPGVVLLTRRGVLRAKR